MQSDLQGLEITKGELKHLSGIEPSEVFRPSILTNSGQRLNFLLQELLMGLALTPIVVGFLYTFIILPTLGASVSVAIACLIITPLAIIVGRWFWLKTTRLEAIATLLDEVDRYNAVIKAIDINDQIEAAGKLEASLNDRHTVIEALQLTRDDLIRALRTEKILRENKAFIGTNPELFANNLITLRALQVSDQANEYGQFLNQALQIGVSIHAEMRKLQSKRSH